MMEVLTGLWYLRRDLISDEYDAALEALSQQLDMKVHKYPSGTQCWTWIVPEKWTCHEAYLETVDGKRMFSYSDNPLHVVSYSLPYEGVVSRAELLRHLHVHPKISNAIPFVGRYYARDWGLCCSQEQRKNLTEERYRVVIKSEFSPGTLKVGEAVAHGKSDRCIMLCAHLCHPAMANDDMAGVVVGMEVMRRLRERKDLRFTYRYLIVPETIGSIAYLSHNEKLIGQMKGGLFLEMLGLDNPPALQLSYGGNSEIDRCLVHAFRDKAKDGWIGSFRTVIGNDERQFNAPGVRVPMLSLSRVLQRDSPDWPYREYHSNFDNPDLVSARRLGESVDLVLAMLDVVEANQIPHNRFSGEVFMSRFGMHVDFYEDPDGHKALFDVMYEIDGTNSLVDIADKLKLPFAFVLRVTHELKNHGLVEFAE